MTLLIAWLLALFALLGVGSATRSSSATSSASSGPLQPEPTVPREPRPPAILLRSRAGDQVGVSLDYEIQTGSSGYGGAAPARPPSHVTVVRPGADVSITMRGAGRTQRLVLVRPFGCGDRAVAAFLLPRERTAWRVSLRPGAYELDVTVLYFRVGRESGKATAALGLAVEPRGAPRIRTPTAHDFVCPRRSGLGVGGFGTIGLGG